MSWRELTIGAAVRAEFCRPRERAVAKRIVCGAFKSCRGPWQLRERENGKESVPVSPGGKVTT